MKFSVVLSVAIVFLLLLSCFVFSDFSVQASAYGIKAVHVDLDCIKANSGHYISNWRSLLTGLNCNAIRVVTGTSGINVWGANIIDNPSDWATNLMSLFDTINPDRTGRTGLKFWFQDLLTVGIEDMHLGTAGVPYLESEKYQNGVGWYSYTAPWGSVYYRKDVASSAGIAETKTYIDKLAGENSLGYDFIKDPRVLAWAFGNELWVGYGAGNPTYDWTVAMMDYVHA
jgi:hypothetical protein